MGRYVSGGANSVPRSMIVSCYASDPAIAVPPWAQGGRGVVRVTGVGAGASGNVTTSSGNTIGGGAGAFARKHPMSIPAGVATIAVEIGMGGAAVTASGSATGNPGGHTKLTIGTSTLILQGGGNGVTNYAFNGGIPLCGNSVTPITMNGPNNTGTSMFGDSGASGIRGAPSSLAIGANGVTKGGGMSPWGTCLILSDTPSISTNGANASGYGAGGQGAFWGSGAAVSSGKGADGFLLLEFVEGA